MYNYRATVVSVYDGDTLTLDIDLGFHITVRETFRLARIDAPELRGGTTGSKARAQEARDFVLSEIPPGTEVVITTEKQGKYGRYIAEVLYESGEDVFNLSNRLVSKGLAVNVRY